MGKKNGLGFTLIELLIVIAILALLAAVLLPVFARVREQAHRGACASNLSQVGLAFLQYTQDNNGTFPPVLGDKAVGWAGRIYPYVKNAAVYACPDDNTPSVSAADRTAVACSYSLNSNFLPSETLGPSAGVTAVSPSFHAGIPISALVAPASTVQMSEVSGAPVVVDEIDEGTSDYTQAPPGGFSSPDGDGLVGNEFFCGGGWGADSRVPGQVCATYATGSRVAEAGFGMYGLPRHSGGANYLAADGHISFLLPAQVSVGPSGAADRPESLPVGTHSTPQAAGTRDLRLSGGTPVALTYSVN